MFYVPGTEGTEINKTGKKIHTGCYNSEWIGVSFRVVKEKITFKMRFERQKEEYCRWS